MSTARAQTPAAHAADDAAEKDLRPVDFNADVAPIFAAHCLKCHGPERRSGGLRLDARMHAEAGGDTGGDILGGTLDSNELYRRVSSSDRTYRMPKNAAALSADELDRLRRWVIQGTPWPEAGRGDARFGSPGFLDSWFAWAGELAERYRFEYRYALPFGVAFLAAQVVLLAVARAKAARRADRAWAAGRFGKFASRLSGRELTLAWLLLAAGLGVVVMLGHQRKLEGQLADAELERTKFQSHWSKTIYGWPPKPLRPDHPKQVAGTYYRGNCERNPELFNGGNYLTATFRISLCDADGIAIGVGDALPSGGLFVRMEIERAPGTTDQLFSKELMSSAFLSQEFYENSTGVRRDDPVRLEMLEDGKRWAARVPIGKPDDRAKLKGLIYLYTGRIEEDSVRGDPHCAIAYDLHFEHGKLTAESDLWMSAFGSGAVADPTPSGKIPFREWFDHHPIPAITGENSKDPKLLGVEEYEKKGLLTPEEKAVEESDTPPP